MSPSVLKTNNELLLKMRLRLGGRGKGRKGSNIVLFRLLASQTNPFKSIVENKCSLGVAGYRLGNERDDGFFNFKN